MNQYDFVEWNQRIWRLIDGGFKDNSLTEILEFEKAANVSIDTMAFHFDQMREIKETIERQLNALNNRMTQLCMLRNNLLKQKEKNAGSK